MAKKYTLYGANQTRGGRASWCIRELGISDQVEQIDDGPAGMGLQITYDSKYNPNRKVPTLLVREGPGEDVSFSIYESFAVTQYLCKSLGNTELGPRSPEEDAKINQYSLWAQTTIEIPTLAVLTKNPNYVSQFPLDVAAELLTANMKILDTELAGKEYLVGGRFTLADLNTGSIVANWLSGAKFDFAPFPNVDAWVKRLRDRPHFRPPKKAKM